MESTVNICAARPYPICELLELQKSLPAILCPVNQISKHPNIASIFQLPGEALSHPERFKIETQKLVDIMKSTQRSQSTRRQLMQSSEDTEYSTRSERQQTRWNLRQRESSDRSSQPHSAPSGLIAQRSENFQRFYRAVASPTHVRVTAGGRIVPNTRVAAPLPYEWNAEKFCFEPRQQIQDGSSSLRRSAQPQNPPLAAAFPQMFPGGLFPPFDVLPQFHNLGFQHTTQEVSARFSAAEQRSCEQATKNRETLNTLSPIKISPPAQFDHSKPFMFNGQFVYPVPQGFQPPLNKLPVPITMLGNPNFLPGAPGFFPHQFPLTVGNMPNPFIFSQGQLSMPGIQGAYNGTDFVSPPPCLPFPGLIQMSDFTRSQIQGLNNRLNFINSQIASNTNQADEPYLLSQRDATRTQIKTLEGMLRLQETAEGDERKTVSEDATEHKVPLSSFESDKETQANGENLLSTTAAAQGLFTPIIPTESYEIFQTAKHDEPQALPKSIEETAQVESRSKSRLSAAAAMAPPFQPRTLAIGMQPDTFTSVAVAPPAEHASHTIQWQPDSRTSSSISSNRRQASRTPKLHPIPERTHSQHDTVTHTLDEVLPSTFQHPDTFYGQTMASMAPNTTTIASPQSVPYLVGTLPTGITETNASAHDLVYSRPLTNEEVRARYLYFGKAPRSIQSGLPKFDGKDFYPPSPVKEHVEMAVAGQHSVNRRNPRPCVLDFENLFTDPSAPGYKTPSPVRSTALAMSGQPQSDSVTCNNLRLGGIDKSHVPSLHSGGQMWNARHGREPSLPATPPKAVVSHESKVEEDYSMLFMERGVPGYKSPSPPPPTVRNVLSTGNGAVSVPVTPGISGIHVDRLARKDSWVADKIEGASPTRGETSSETSTVEIQLNTQKTNLQKKNEKMIEPPFAERVANFNSEQQTLFLQNMLKNTATMSGPALSGTISSATAQGYLPQYCGSAAASLSPVMIDVAALERDVAHSAAHVGAFKDISNSNLNRRVLNLLAENRPLSRAIPIIRPVAEALDAEAYVRQLQQKAENDIIAHGWNLNTTGTGPIRGSDW